MTSEECIAALDSLEDVGLRASSVERLGEGWSAWVFAAPNGWAYRFPKSTSAADAMRRVGAMLERLHEAAALPLPRYIAWGTFRGLPFAVYRKIEGVALGASAARPSVAVTLAQVLRTLHAQQAEGLPGQVWVDRCAALVAAAEPLIATFPRRVRRGIERDASLLLERVPAVEPTLCHGDLLAEHILVDPGSGDLAGLIDFDDAVLGDPAWDFGVLATTASARFIEDLMSAYDADTDMRVRVALYARLALLKEAVDAMTCGKSGTQYSIPSETRFAQRATLGIEYCVPDLLKRF